MWIDDIVVYTAAVNTDKRKFGYYPPDPQTTEFVYFRGVDNFSPIMGPKFYKLHPHVYFRMWAATVWHDAGFQLVQDIRPVVQESLDGDYDMAALELGFDCKDAYDVGEFCMQAIPGQRNIIKQQLSKYKREGLPEGSGCWACGLLIRRNSKKIRGAMEDWWHNVYSFSYRDQISFPYIVWKHDLKVRTISTALRDELWALRQ